MITVKVENKIIYNGQSMVYTYLQNNKTLKIFVKAALKQPENSRNN